MNFARSIRECFVRLFNLRKKRIIRWFLRHTIRYHARKRKEEKTNRDVGIFAFATNKTIYFKLVLVHLHCVFFSQAHLHRADWLPMQGRIYPNLKTSNFPRLLRQESIYPNLKKRSVFLGKGTKVQTANHAADKTSTSRSAHFPLPGPAARALFRESLGPRPSGLGSPSSPRVAPAHWGKWWCQARPPWALAPGIRRLHSAVVQPIAAGQLEPGHMRRLRCASVSSSRGTCRGERVTRKT
jgi:hypothetical protein